MSFYTKDHFLHRAQLHLSGYQRLFQHCNYIKTIIPYQTKNSLPPPTVNYELLDEEYTGESGLPYHSIHGTLIRLYLGELLWYVRIKPTTSISNLDQDISSMDQIYTIWNQTSPLHRKSWTQFFQNKDRHYLQQKIETQCHRWITFLQNECDTQQLSQQIIHYETHKPKNNIKNEKSLGQSLEHVFDTGTNVRAQIMQTIYTLEKSKLLLEATSMDLH